MSLLSRLQGPENGQSVASNKSENTFQRFQDLVYMIHRDRKSTR